MFAAGGKAALLTAPEELIVQFIQAKRPENAIIVYTSSRICNGCQIVHTVGNKKQEGNGPLDLRAIGQ